MATRGVIDRVPLEGEDTIRLLSLEPADAMADPLRGTLSVVSLAGDPQYEALSYCWGSPFNGQVLGDGEISIAGAKLAITDNLEHALRRFQRTTLDI